MIRFDIVTLFPDFFRGPFDYGVVARALRSGLAEAHPHDLRAFTHDRHRTVDDRPFGGGEGMVLKPQPIAECLEHLAITPKDMRDTARETVILLSAQGRRFTQAKARELARMERITLICGRYEGVDERVSQLLCDQELSIGDYVLSGGELGAAVILDAVVRLLPGVLGHADSSLYESFGLGEALANDPGTGAGKGIGTRIGTGIDTGISTGIDTGIDTGISTGIDTGISTGIGTEIDTGAPGLASETWVSTELQRKQTPPRSTNASAGLLDYPHYTRPADFRGLTVPEPLANGDHLAIRRWRRHAALAKTLANRPDLLPGADLTDADREYLATLGYVEGHAEESGEAK